MENATLFNMASNAETVKFNLLHVTDLVGEYVEGEEFDRPLEPGVLKAAYSLLGYINAEMQDLQDALYAAARRGK